MAFLLDRWFGLILNQRTSWDAFIVCGLPLCGAVPLDRAGRPRPALARPGGRPAGEGARPTKPFHILILQPPLGDVEELERKVLHARAHLFEDVPKVVVKNRGRNRRREPE